MDKKSVTSHDQQGGITAFEVDVKQGNGNGNHLVKKRGLPLWAKWLVAICTVGALVAVIIFGVLSLRGGG